MTDLHRDRVIEQLSAGFADGRLDVDELERRLALAHAADTPATLDTLVTDLVPVRSAAALVPARMRVVMSSIERRGVWTVPAHLAARVLWGNLVLDLRDAQLAPGLTTFDLSITMASVEIIVGPGVAVDVDASSWLGNVEDRTRAPVTATSRVRIAGRVSLGNLEVSTRLRGETRREARRRRRWERRARRRHELPWPLD